MTMANLTGSSSAIFALAYLGMTIAGLVILLRDEFRIRRETPKPEEIARLADELTASHGENAFREAGVRSIAAVEAGDSKSKLLWRAVSGELIRRQVEAKPQK